MLFPQTLTAVRKEEQEVDLEERAKGKGRAKEKESRVESQKVEVRAKVEVKAMLHLHHRDLLIEDHRDGLHLPFPNPWARTLFVSVVDRKDT